MTTSVRARRPRIAYVGGWLGRKNLGDEAMVDSVRETFRPCGVVPIHLTPELASWARHRSLFTASVYAGGTLINRNDAALRTARYTLTVSPYPITFGTGVALRSFWGTQSDWSDQMAEWLEVVRQFAYVGVRGPLSAAELQRAGLPGVEVVGDPVLALADPRRPRVPRLHHLGLNVGTSPYGTWTGWDSVLSNYIELARIAKDAGWTVSWFVVWPRDLDVTREVARASDTGQHIRTFYTDARGYMDAVSTLSVFAGLKLHAVALATCALVPSLMIEYQPKCRDFMASIDQEAYTFRTDEFTAEGAWEQVGRIESDLERIQQSLCSSISALQERQRHRAEELTRAIAERNSHE